MTTYLDLQNSVARRVVDTVAAVQAEVPDLINLAITEAQLRHNFGVMRADQAYSTVVANGHVLGNLPTDFKEYRTKPYYVTALGDKWTIRKGTSLNAVLTAVRGDQTRNPLWIVEGNPDPTTGLTGLLVYPTPDGLSDFPDGEYRITVPYWRFLPALSAGSDHNWFTDNGRQFIQDWATAEAFRMDWNEDRANYWQNQADAGGDTRSPSHWKTLRQRDITNQLSGVDTLVPHLGADDPYLDN